MYLALEKYAIRILKLAVYHVCLKHKYENHKVFGIIRHSFFNACGRGSQWRKNTMENIDNWKKLLSEDIIVSYFK